MSDLQIVPSGTNIVNPTQEAPAAFIKKLVEILDSNNHNDVVRWSEEQNAILVLDDKRIGEVLGRYFKHTNYTSFVRQLNMYGFRKITGMHQGVLIAHSTDSTAERFEHPDFKRGRPDLLHKIQRKKQQPQTSGQPSKNTSAPTAITNNQVLDLSTIVNGITAIQRTQTVITTELNKLRETNDILWRDAITARAKSNKQQDVINRIVKFLQGTFGGNVNNPDSPGVVQHTGSDEQTAADKVVRPRPRLMIEQGPSTSPKSRGVAITEVEDEDAPAIRDYTRSSSTNRFVSIETPGTSAAASPSASSEVSTPIFDASYFNTSEPQTQQPSSEELKAMQPIIEKLLRNPNQLQQFVSFMSTQVGGQQQQLIAPPPPPAPPPPTIQPPNVAAPPTNALASSSRLTQCEPIHDYPRFLSSPPSSFKNLTYNPPLTLNDPSSSLLGFNPSTNAPSPLDGLISFDNPNTGEKDNNSPLWSSEPAAESTSSDDDVQASTHQFLQMLDGLGLSPSLLESITRPPAIDSNSADASASSRLSELESSMADGSSLEGLDPSTMSMMNALDGGSGSSSSNQTGLGGAQNTMNDIADSNSSALEEFDFAAYLHDLPNTGTGADGFSNHFGDMGGGDVDMDLASTAFLDEVSSPPIANTSTQPSQMTFQSVLAAAADSNELGEQHSPQAIAQPSQLPLPPQPTTSNASTPAPQPLTAAMSPLTPASSPMDAASPPSLPVLTLNKSKGPGSTQNQPPQTRGRKRKSDAVVEEGGAVAQFVQEDGQPSVKRGAKSKRKR